RSTAHPRRAARCCGDGTSAAARDPSGKASAHGRLRDLGDGLRDRAGTFMKAYAGNIDEAVETVLNANPVATGGGTLMATQTTWTGTATDLLDLLGRIVGEKATKAKTWPVDATRLGGKLRRAATFLRKVGIEISIGAREARTRSITITSFSKPQEVGNLASSASSVSSANDSNNLAMTLAMTLARDADGQRHHDDANGPGGSSSVIASVTANLLKNKDDDADDASDAKLHTPQGSEKAEVPCLSDGRIRELAGDYLDAAAMELEETGDVDRAALERRLRENLTTAGVPFESVEVELERIMEVLTAF